MTMPNEEPTIMKHATLNIIGFDAEKPIELKYTNNMTGQSQTIVFEPDPVNDYWSVLENHYTTLTKVGKWQAIQGMKVREVDNPIGNDMLVDAAVKDSY
ncbi:hypothetical protein, partial [Vibrio sp. 10N.222.49.C9]